MPAYGTKDSVLWLADVPGDQRECRSPFLTAEPDESPEFWLEVRKTKPPVRPRVPDAVIDWVREQDLDSPDTEPDILSEITVLVEKEVADPEPPPNEQRIIVQKFPEIRRLEEHPKVQDMWLDYLTDKWVPWAAEMRRWQAVHRVYEDADVMRRRLEEAEERYELFLGVGLLQWRDSKGRTVKRHLLTGPAEVEFDAARGIIAVVPAASFETFRVELDMLDPEDQPQLSGTRVYDGLEELDIQAWDQSKISGILLEIANRAKADSEVDMGALAPAPRAEDTLRVVFAPAVVLRERRPTAFEETVGKLLPFVEGEADAGTTAPWDRFLAEGQPVPASGQESALTRGDVATEALPERVLFPLPTNQEQRQILDRHRAFPCVVVKGPPGTGKSHTIANLMCHLLASGERVLVTAQAPKALTVLRDKLPEDLQDLCVTALGSSREDQRLLEESVLGILRRQNEWQGAVSAQKRIDQLEQELLALEEELSRTEGQLRESREAETHSHRLIGGYEGTAARIAERLDQERDALGWFPEALHGQPSFPFQRAEVEVVASVHAELSHELEDDLRLDTGDFDIPDLDEFQRLRDELIRATRYAGRSEELADSDKLRAIERFPTEPVERTAASLRAVDEAMVEASHVLGDLAEQVLQDLLIGRRERWHQVRERAADVVRQIDKSVERLGGARVALPSDVTRDRLLADAKDRLQHFQRGGWRGFWLLKPRVIRETDYLEKRCAVDGRPPSDHDRLLKVVAFLQINALVDTFADLWPDPFHHVSEGLTQAIGLVREHVDTFGRVLDLFDDLGSDPFPCVPLAQRADTADPAERAAWLSAVDARLAKAREQEAKEPLSRCLDSIVRCRNLQRSHPCLAELEDALRKVEPIAWGPAWEKRERLREKQHRLAQYKQLLGGLEETSTSLAAVLREHQGDPTWNSRLMNIESAWAWASARGWLGDVADRDRNQKLVRSYHRTRARIEEKTGEIAALQAWHRFFERLDESTVQYLKAWTRVQDRVGKGTGKYAYKHRKTARGYLTRCIPKIPAWIMPLHKLWDTVEPAPGLFDTVIIDEASQAGIDALPILMLAKRIIVVGDEKQNSPEAVGVREDDVARLALKYLQDFYFRDEFRPNTSFFDHAERSFGNVISLREHFRCVPEIIRFSNDLCYRDAPLIPLRQAPPDRLQPLRTTYVEGGMCEGVRQNIHNRVEAQEVVETVCKCLDDEAYDGKSMGVIALQGRVQAEVIASMLAGTVDPSVIKERRLRCGVPATFQGDERDVMFLSLVMAPNVHHRALTTPPDVRRFNVAMSRARDQAWLFHSVQVHDLSAECLRHKALTFFQGRLPEVVERLREDRERLEREVRRPSRRPKEQPPPYESWFEVDVALELLRRDYRILPQYEVAGKRIDIVIESLDVRLAVECDGDAWHGPDEYEHDMARQRQLERAGWTFVRVRESEFYADRTGAIEDVVRACDELGVRPVDMFAPAEAPGEQQTHDEEDSSRELAEDELPEAEDTSTQERVASESGPFTGYSKELDFPDPRHASAGNVRAVLRTIIEKECPLTRASACSLYLKGCPHIQRRGKAVLQSLNQAIAAMLRAGEIVQEDELKTGSPESLVLRSADAPRVRERPAGRRDLREIPPSELAVVLDRLGGSIPDGERSDDDLFRKLLDHYGFSHMTSVRRRHLRLVLDRRDAEGDEPPRGNADSEGDKPRLIQRHSGG